MYIHINVLKRQHIYIDIDLYIYIIIVYLHAALLNGKLIKRKSRQFSLIHLPFAHREYGRLSFVRLFTKKQTEVIRLQTD
jgi:hypothetical protein